MGRASTTRYYMEGYQVALEYYRSMYGELPPMEAGLASLIAEDLIGPDASSDGWGRVFLYQRLSEHDYRVVSVGADGERGTADDWVLTGEGGLVRPGADAASTVVGALSRQHVADLLPGERLEGLSPSGEGRRDLLILGDGVTARFLLDGVELGRTSVESEVLAVSDLGAFCYLEETDDESLLVAGEVRISLASGWASAEYLAGTDTLIFTDGDRTRCLDTGGQVLGEPAHGPWGELLAFRERRDDGDYVHTSGGVFGPAVWAGDPVASRDGQHFAVLANFGGTPTADWEQVRERTLEPWRDPRRYSWTPPHQLFEGGTFRAILDGAEGPDFVSASDLVFKEGADWAGVPFRAQVAEGDWQVIYQSDKTVGPTVRGEAVGPPLVDDAGVWSNYDFRDVNGRNWLKSTDKTYETGEVYSRHAGPDAGFVYAVEDNRLEQGRRLVWLTPDEAEPFWSRDTSCTAGSARPRDRSFASTPRASTVLSTAAGPTRFSTSCCHPRSRAVSPAASVWRISPCTMAPSCSQSITWTKSRSPSRASAAA